MRVGGVSDVPLVLRSRPARSVRWDAAMNARSSRRRSEPWPSMAMANESVMRRVVWFVGSRMTVSVVIVRSRSVCETTTPSIMAVPWVSAMNEIRDCRCCHRGGPAVFVMGAIMACDSATSAIRMVNVWWTTMRRDASGVMRPSVIAVRRAACWGSWSSPVPQSMMARRIMPCRSRRRRSGVTGGSWGRGRTGGGGGRRMVWGRGSTGGGGGRHGTGRVPVSDLGFRSLTGAASRADGAGGDSLP